jgi:hypothetical protein
MTGHKPFDELRDELLRAPGAAEQIVEERGLLEEQLARSKARDGAPTADVPPAGRSPHEAAPPARPNTRG